MAASVPAALASALRTMPAPAMPGLIDALLRVTGASPGAVFRELLGTLELQEIMSDSTQLFEAFKATMLHLLRLSEETILNELVHKVCLPLLLRDSTKGSRFLAEAIATKRSWEYALTTLIPSCSFSMVAAVDAKAVASDNDNGVVLTLTTASQLVCQVLALADDDNVRNEDDLKAFFGSIIDRFWDPCLRLLSESLDESLRSLVLQTLLPSLLRTSKLCERSRGFNDAWACCKVMFASGETQRGDAYRILSMLDDLSEVQTLEPLFWEELRAGLVNSDPLIRKRALHVLKNSLGNLMETPASRSTIEKAQKDVTKRERWANEEAKSLGMESLNSDVVIENAGQEWRSFILLYEMLEEYGIHLVEAAWEKQIASLMRSACIDSKISTVNNINLDFSWILVLFDRGFKHGNPQVRRHVLQSFLDMESGMQSSIPQHFLLGTLLHALNDPVHYRDFGGVNNIYSSNVGKLANRYFKVYSTYMNLNTRACFVTSLCKAVIRKPLCRPGLMTLASCLEAAAVTESSKEKLTGIHHTAELLDSLKVIVDTSKYHFNPCYRSQVCVHVLKTLSSLAPITELNFDRLSVFLTAFPRDFLSPVGPLRPVFDDWLKGSGVKGQEFFLDGLRIELVAFLKPPDCKELSYVFTDDDVENWREHADRWIRVLFIGLSVERLRTELLLLLEQYAVKIYDRVYMPVTVPEKILLLVQSLSKEWIILGDRTSSCLKVRLCNFFLNTMGELVSYAEKSVVTLINYDLDVRMDFPASKGRLGGPSLRWLPLNAGLVAIKAVLAVETLVECYVWLSANDTVEDSVTTALWKVSWKLADIYNIQEDIRGEFQLAGFEALSFVCKALPFANSSTGIRNATEEISSKDGPANLDPASFVDNLVARLYRSFKNIEGKLIRSRRAVLSRHKWSCLDGLLSLKRPQDKLDRSAASQSTLLSILQDALDSMGSAGEDYVVPIFSCVRWLILWDVLDMQAHPNQVVWELVRSGWACIADCNKRKIGLYATFLSSFFHPKLFGVMDMHNVSDSEEGPLKWLLGKLIELGSRSPRIMRLTAMHVSGLWVQHPETTVYYMQEIKSMCLYGGEAIDEEFDGEVADKELSSREFATLIQSSDPELQEMFMNSEMFVRVAIAVMMDKLAQIVEKGPSDDYELKVSVPAAANCGRLLLMHLLRAAVHNLDLAKELYKKNSAIHRRKVRVWQMLCILTRFVDQSMLTDVTALLEQSLYRNNMPSVRQYIEMFAIQLYLRFPDLVKEHLVYLLCDVNMKSQALSSYVYIAANILKFLPLELQQNALEELLPAVLPHMTSHHHNLRTFTQVLFFHVFSVHKKTPALSEKLGSKCLRAISSYLEENSDCTRLRTSVDQFMFKLEPSAASKPRGLFCNIPNDTTKMLDDRPFECVPVAVLDKVTELLNESREELRETMAANALYLNFGDEKHAYRSESAGKDYQKKITPYKDMTDTAASRLADMEYEDNLLFSTIDKKGRELAKAYEGRQDLIVVASLIERIPNLAGLARTCEVFKASALTVADRKLLEDRQFKLISVTAEQWIPILEVAEMALLQFLKRKKAEGYTILGLEQTANSIAVNTYQFPSKAVLVLGREKDGIPVNIIQALDTCLEIPQLGVIRSLNVHVSGAIAVWEYTKQQLKGRAMAND